jgi:hypothetical protein
MPAIELTDDQVITLRGCLETCSAKYEADLVGASHSNQAGLETEIENISDILDKLPLTAGGRRRRRGGKTRKGRKGRKGTRRH